MNILFLKKLKFKLLFFFPDTMSYSKRLMLIIKALIVASVEGSSSHLFFAHFAFIE